MTQQPDALRLADWLGTLRLSHADHPMNCLLVAEELRRLHSVNAQLLEALEGLERYSDGIICYASTMGEYEPNLLVFNARAAIAAAKGEA